MSKRTSQQNKSAHVFFELLAQALNDAGLDMRAVLKEDVDIPWSKDTVKDYLWRPIQKAMLQKKSTTELEKIDEIDRVHEVLMRHLGEKFGIDYIPWPAYKTDYEKAPLQDDLEMRVN